MCLKCTQMKTFGVPLMFWNTHLCLRAHISHTLNVDIYCKNICKVWNDFLLFLTNWITGKWDLQRLTGRDCSIPMFMNFRKLEGNRVNEANCEGALLRQRCSHVIFGKSMSSLKFLSSSRSQVFAPLNHKSLMVVTIIPSSAACHQVCIQTLHSYY